MNYEILHWYSDNDSYSVYSLKDFPNVILHIDLEQEEVISVMLLNEDD